MQIAQEKLTHRGSFGQRLHANSPADKLSSKVNALNLEVRLSPSTGTLNKRVSNIGSQLVKDTRQSSKASAAQLESRLLFPDNPPSPQERDESTESSVPLRTSSVPLRTSSQPQSAGLGGDAVFGQASTVNLQNEGVPGGSIQADVIYSEEAVAGAARWVPTGCTEDEPPKPIEDDIVNAGVAVVHADMTGIKPCATLDHRTKVQQGALEARMMSFDRENMHASLLNGAAPTSSHQPVGQHVGEHETNLDTHPVGQGVDSASAPTHEACGHETPEARDSEACLRTASGQADAEITTPPQWLLSPPSPHNAMVPQWDDSPAQDAQWVSPAPREEDDAPDTQWISPAPREDDAEESVPDPAERFASEEADGTHDEEEACETPETEPASRGEDELASADSTASPSSVFLDKEERELLEAAERGVNRSMTPEIDAEEERLRLAEQLAMKDELARWREQQIELKRRKDHKSDGDPPTPGPNRRMLTKNDVESRLYGPASDDEGAEQKAALRGAVQHAGSFKERVRNINLAIKWKSSKF